MKALFVIALFALTLTTGFTCSKDTPEAAKTEAPAQDPAAQPSQEQMAQPAADAPAAESAPVAQPAEGETK